MTLWGVSPMDVVLACPARCLSHDHPCAGAGHAAAPRFWTGAVHTAVRVNVTWVTPLGEEVASMS
jgi:hypothetical protein